MSNLKTLMLVASVIVLSSTAIAVGDEFIHPRIQQHGEVVKLPAAEHQPRPQSRIVVDVTRGGEPNTLNPAVAKLARFVNIYAGAGRESADAQIAVVLHGDATLVGLKDEAYRRHFDVEKNPNLDLLQKLTANGVRIYVCGQSLAHKGAKANELDDSVKHAVSALTALVNLQSDRFAYIPLTK